MPPFPSSKQALSLAKETVKGVAEAAATAHLPVREQQGGREKTKLPDMSLRGSAVDMYSEADGVFHGMFALKGDVFADTIGHPLLGIMGEEAITGGAAPYAHRFTVLNTGDQQPPAHTLWDNYAVSIRRYPGAQFSSLKFKWSDNGLLEYDAEAMTLADTVVAAPVPSYGTLAPHPAWASTCLIGGVAAYPLDGELNISRMNAEPIHVQDGLQSPRHIWVGALVVEGQANLLMENDTYYQQFIDNTQPTLDFAFTTGAGAALTGLRFLMSKVTWREPKIDRSGSYIKLPISFKAIANTTDVGVSAGFGPIAITASNARASIY